MTSTLQTRAVPGFPHFLAGLPSVIRQFSTDGPDCNRLFPVVQAIYFQPAEARSDSLGRRKTAAEEVALPSLGQETRVRVEVF